MLDEKLMVRWMILIADEIQRVPIFFFDILI